MIRSSRVLLQHRQPMIRFLGRRHEPPQVVDHSPQPHPQSPTHALPDSFATYRKTAQQHGPLGGGARQQQQQRPIQSSAVQGGGLGARSGHSLGSIQPAQGQYFDRTELPQRFQRLAWSAEEMDAIESGGASMWA